jgi:hypothetical protein
MTETTSENKKSSEYAAHSSTPKEAKEETTISSFADKPTLSAPKCRRIPLPSQTTKHQLHDIHKNHTTHFNNAEKIRQDPQKCVDTFGGMGVSEAGICLNTNLS